MPGDPVGLRRPEGKSGAILNSGHTSSEWKEDVGCAGIAGTVVDADRTYVAFECNMELSQQRATTVYQACRTINRDNGSFISDSEYVKNFFPVGQSSLEFDSGWEGR